MPRLFTGLEIPPEIGDALAVAAGGLPGARWIDRANYHVTLRFIGDVDGPTAREIAAALDEIGPLPPLRVTLGEWSAFGGDRPRALIARVEPDPALKALQAEHESLMRRVGLQPETRRFTPHVTLARLRGFKGGDVAAHLAILGYRPPLAFEATRFVLYSARDSVGGGPYLVEAAYPFAAGFDAFADTDDEP